MAVHLTAETEAQLSQLAADQGRDADTLAQKVIDDYLAETARYIEAVKKGEDAFARGDYLTQAEVEARMAKLIGT